MARNMPDCGMAAVDQRCRPWTETDLIPPILCQLSNVLSDQLSHIPTASPKQSDEISCFLVSWSMEFSIPIPVCQVVADALQFFGAGFSREFDDLLKYLHPTRGSG